MIKINTKNRIKTAIALLFLSALMISFNFISIYVLIVFGIFSILEFLEMTKKIFFNRLFRYIINTTFIFYILFFCYFFFYFLNFIHLKIIIFILLFGCVASDIGGYFVGKSLKGPKLIKISPKKTYSGAIGSVIFTCFTISILFYLITNNFSYVILIISILHFKKIKYVVQKIHFISIISLVIIQVVIGIYVVLSNVQISLGSIHQIVGSLLFALTFSYFLLLKRKKI